ncbi:MULTISPECIES: TetR/AcrR family transcriptional regulator [unclassified Streptomyces]|uniref:TetR/AcrR family transcriptional regulator n=1 Tax=unclassified Streptomyces TaxID=2593676 RepID=UPI0022B6B4FC|nr:MULTISPECIES: TetR/AcrR family transcriptional regulator [unclassified Streptomyces]MCZ7417543.1 TetR/AcrR family transcriptional regulator [Streptomyces sp. WMMC897]MCZ7432628.1 TetR/AcrR family transcriptional regulator [Streptomyces sp. WMMC1477]
MGTTGSVEQGREVRSRLLAAAAELIAERGWTGVRTRPLAERAGVGPGLVHYHFSSLQALLSEAALSALRGLVERLGVLLDQARDVDEGLDALLVALDRYSGRDATSLLCGEAYLAATRDPELCERLAGLLAEARGRFARWLAENGAPTPEATAAVLAAAIDGVMLHRPLNPGLTSAHVGPVLRRLLRP